MQEKRSIGPCESAPEKGSERRIAWTLRRGANGARAGITASARRPEQRVVGAKGPDQGCVIAPSTATGGRRKHESCVARFRGGAFITRTRHMAVFLWIRPVGTEGDLDIGGQEAKDFRVSVNHAQFQWMGMGDPDHEMTAEVFKPDSKRKQQQQDAAGEQ
jgi:hypothetical protein